MTVYLVGAGPGDPELITVRGANLLRSADVVVYDRLADPNLLDLAPPNAERIFVGKAPRQPTMSQEQINQILVDRGRTHSCVVRLKGGDPFVFGRGGEEATALQAAEVRFEIVPGITSAIAAPAYAGIPITSRQVALSFTVVTGHEDPNGQTTVDWEALAKVGGTIVVLMGASRIAQIAARLIAGGLAATTPVTAIIDGTTTRQRTVDATLQTIGTQTIDAPATIVIGAVTKLATPWTAGTGPGHNGLTELWTDR